MGLPGCLRPLVARTRCVSPCPPLLQGPAAHRGRVGGRGRAGSRGGQHLCTAPDPINLLRGVWVGGTGQPGVPMPVGSPGSCVAAAVTGFTLRAPPAAAGPRRGVVGAPGPPLCAQGMRGRRWRWSVPRTPMVPGPGGRGLEAGSTPGASPHPSATCWGHRAQDRAQEKGAAGYPSEPRGFTCTRRHPQPGQGLP